MDLQLKVKTALVSGSTAGIGHAIATSLAKEGSSVIINGRTEERVNEAIAAIKNMGAIGKLSGLVADLGTATGVAQVVEQFPHVDILVNNLGIFEPKPFAEISDADWMKFFEVNVLSGVCQLDSPWSYKVRGGDAICGTNGDSSKQGFGNC